MPVSTAALKQIAAVGGILSLGGASYFYKRLQDNLASGSYYPKTMAVVSNHRGAIEVLGLPIKTKYINLGNQFNSISARNAQLAIPVKGSVRPGLIYTWATRESVEEDWKVQRVDLEITNPKRKVTIYAASSSDEDQSADDGFFGVGVETSGDTTSDTGDDDTTTTRDTGDGDSEV